MPQLTKEQREALRVGDLVFVEVDRRGQTFKTTTVLRRTPTTIVVALHGNEYRFRRSDGRLIGQMGTGYRLFGADAPEVIAWSVLDTYNRATYGVGETGRKAVRHWAMTPHEAASDLIRLAGDLAEAANKILATVPR